MSSAFDTAAGPDRYLLRFDTNPAPARQRPATAPTVDRTLPRHAPHKRVALSRHPRVRWWRIAMDHLWRLAMNPVVEWSTPEYRGVDIHDTWGFRIHRATGAVSPYNLRRHGRWLHREHKTDLDCWLVGSDPGTAWIGGLILDNAARWARLAGMAPEHIPRQWNRLLNTLGPRWTADGTAARMWRVRERALALDEELLRLVRASSTRQSDPEDVFLGDYLRCLADRANLQTLAREAPQLLRLYTTLLPGGAGAAEPKQALKQAFLADGRRPARLWRTMYRLDAATVDVLAAYGRYSNMYSLVDWIELLQALDLPCQPPAGWMQGLRRLLGYGPVSRVHDAPWARPLLTAHLRAWMAADDAGRSLLFLELNEVLEDVTTLSPAPVPPPGRRAWPAWVRWATQAQAAQFESEADAACAWDAAQGLPLQGPTPPLQGTRVELRRLLTSRALLAEGRAMEHCVHDFRDQLVDGTAALYSVHLVRTGKHIGTASVGLDASAQVRGRTNRKLSPEHRREVMRLLLPVPATLWGSAGVAY